MKGVRSDLVDLRLVVQQLNDRESLVTMKATAMLSLSPKPRYSGTQVGAETDIDVSKSAVIGMCARCQVTSCPFPC